VAEVRSPTVRRRELGALLRSFRLNRGLTVDQVAGLLMCSPSKVSRMETGHRGVTARDIRDLCDIYGVDDQAERDRLTTLAREGKQQAWWKSHDLDSFETYVGLEAEAASIKYYNSTIVPGLMQTAAYARAMYEAGFPRQTDERIAELIDVRLTRQQVLVDKTPLSFDGLLDEAVLHRTVGGPRVMGAQLDRIIELARLPNVTVQIIPFSIGAHPAMESTFNILEFTGEMMTSVVYIEGLGGFVYLDRPQDIARYSQVFDHLRTIALTPRESSELMLRIRTRY